MELLVTGFGPFPGMERNPTAEIVERLVSRPPASGPVRSLVLPTSFLRAPEELSALLTGSHPDAVLALGVAHSADRIRLECWARNFRRAGRADVDGLDWRGGWLDKNGPAVLRSTLPLKELERHLRRAGFPVAPSVTAGSYVCNALFYHLLRTIETDCPAGFVHLTDPGRPNAPLTLDQLEQAVRLMIDTIRTAVSEPRTDDLCVGSGA